MFDRFTMSFVRDGTSQTPVALDAAAAGLLRGQADLAHFLKEFGGASFNRGLYRALESAQIVPSIVRIARTFAGYQDRIVPFAVDWLNRIYCVDFARTAGPCPLLVLFSHLADEILEIPTGIVAFHNETLIDCMEDVLETPLFDSFLATQRRKCLGRREGAGMVAPLVLGGAYSIDNMALIDTVVDWDFTTRVMRQTRAIPQSATLRSMAMKGDRGVFG